MNYVGATFTADMKTGPWEDAANRRGNGVNALLMAAIKGEETERALQSRECIPDLVRNAAL